MKNHDRVDLQGNRYVSQQIRKKQRSGGVAVYEHEDSLLMVTPHVLVKCETAVHRRAMVVEKFGDICTAEVIILRMNVLMYNKRVIEIIESLQSATYRC